MSRLEQLEKELLDNVLSSNGMTSISEYKLYMENRKIILNKIAAEKKREAKLNENEI